MKEIAYKEENGYMIPDLKQPEQAKYNLGPYARAHRKFLKEEHQKIYTCMMTSGELMEHLHQVDMRAEELEEHLMEQMMKQEGVTEQLKAEDMMGWVRKVNNIKNRAREIVNDQVTYSI